MAFDPNLRPRLWESVDEMTAAVMEGARVSDIVLPSFEDEAEYFGDADPQATAARYASEGADLIIVKNGPAEVFYQNGDESGVVTVPPVAKVVDTTAAGDSFNAGFFAALHQGKAIPDCILSGASIAGQVIGGRGALVKVTR